TKKRLYTLLLGKLDKILQCVLNIFNLFLFLFYHSVQFAFLAKLCIKNTRSIMFFPIVPSQTLEAHQIPLMNTLPSSRISSWIHRTLLFCRRIGSRRRG